ANQEAEREPIQQGDEGEPSRLGGGVLPPATLGVELPTQAILDDLPFVELPAMMLVLPHLDRMLAAEQHLEGDVVLARGGSCRRLADAAKEQELPVLGPSADRLVLGEVERQLGQDDELDAAGELEGALVDVVQPGLQPVGI